MANSIATSTSRHTAITSLLRAQTTDVSAFKSNQKTQTTLINQLTSASSSSSRNDFIMTESAARALQGANLPRGSIVDILV